MNERIRSIKNTLNMVSNLRDTCENQLREVLSIEWMDKCREFIEVRREHQHLKTLERQKIKFERLLDKEKVREGDHITSCGSHDGYHSDLTNQNNMTDEGNRRENTWVKNLSSTPLTQDEMKLLANGPSYAIVPRISFLFVNQVLKLVELSLFNLIKSNFIYLVNEALAFSKSFC